MRYSIQGSIRCDLEEGDIPVPGFADNEIVASGRDIQFPRYVANFCPAFQTQLAVRFDPKSEYAVFIAPEVSNGNKEPFPIRRKNEIGSVQVAFALLE